MGILGAGGFGAVYQAQDVQRHDAPVAIKSITLHHLSPEQIIEATDTFNREVRLLSGLEHPNLPRIHDHFTRHRDATLHGAGVPPHPSAPHHLP